MFTASDNAADAIRQLVANNDVPDGTGLRITTDADAGSLRLSLTAQPGPGDTVYDAGDARIFLDAAAAQARDGQAIDAVSDDEGRVQFTLGQLPR
jgi:iron-sulfur cluster assembly protein